MTFNGIEKDIKARSYKFSLQVISLIDDLGKDLSSQIIARQVLRSATSVGANIVEAQASPTRRDFALFMSHALKSANETCYWLKLLRDSRKVDTSKIELFITEADQLAKILGASLVTIKAKGLE